MATARDLTITSWARKAGDDPFTVGVPGLKITGWWPGSPPPIRVFDDLHRIWQQAATVKIELDILEDADHRKHQLCAYVRIHKYPESWLDVVRDSLAFLVEQGAAISWAGGWECFLHYSPAEQFAGCYAAHTAATGLVGAGNLDEPVKYVDRIRGAAERLHRAVAEAASSESGRRD